MKIILDMIKASIQPVFPCRRTPFMTSIIITIIFDMNEASLKPLFLCRRTPFMISSFHLTNVMH